MQVRYENWVNGLNSDWLVSRQRYFGVPVPVWYPLGADGEPDHARPIVPDEVEPAHRSDDRRACRATTSRTARRAGRLRRRPRRHGHLGHLVADAADRLRLGGRSRPSSPPPSRWTCAPRGPRSSGPGSSPPLLRSHLEHDALPWRDTTLNGWVLDPDHKKISKSKGNAVTPMPFIDEFGSDAVRYWACNGRPGTDTAVDTGVMKIGRRLAIKILNASKFSLGRLGDGPAPGIDAVTEPLDRALLAQAGRRGDRAATAAFEEFDYARAQEMTETFFWSFCDDYVELVKTRAYGEEDAARRPTRPGPRWHWPSRSSCGSSRPSSPS